MRAWKPRTVENGSWNRLEIDIYSYPHNTLVELSCILVAMYVYLARPQVSTYLSAPDWPGRPARSVGFWPSTKQSVFHRLLPPSGAERGSLNLALSPFLASAIAVFVSSSSLQRFPLPSPLTTTTTTTPPWANPGSVLAIQPGNQC